MVHARGLRMKARLSACCTHIERPRRRARSHIVGCEKDEREMSKAATSLWSAESCSLHTTAALQASKRGSRLNPWWKRTPRHDILSFFLSLSQPYISRTPRKLLCFAARNVSWPKPQQLSIQQSSSFEDQAGMWVYLSFLCSLYLTPLDVKPWEQVRNPVAPVGNLGSTQEFLYWIQYFHYTLNDCNVLVTKWSLLCHGLILGMGLLGLRSQQQPLSINHPPVYALSTVDPPWSSVHHPWVNNVTYIIS
jgi:hypothetical protein